MSIRIVEIKAKSENSDHVRSVLRMLDATFIGEDLQVDTYFKVNNGRLKLRQGNIENTLIQYNRPNSASPKLSNVQLYKPGDVKALYLTLKAGLDVLVEVRKRREIYFVDNVKVHIDSVDDLGSFIEIEAIDEVGRFSASELRAQCVKLMDDFAIGNEDLITHSYSDLLLASKNFA